MHVHPLHLFVAFTSRECGDNITFEQSEVNVEYRLIPSLVTFMSMCIASSRPDWDTACKSAAASTPTSDSFVSGATNHGDTRNIAWKVGARLKVASTMMFGALSQLLLGIRVKIKKQGNVGDEKSVPDMQDVGDEEGVWMYETEKMQGMANQDIVDDAEKRRPILGSSLSSTTIASSPYRYVPITTLVGHPTPNLAVLEPGKDRCFVPAGFLPVITQTSKTSHSLQQLSTRESCSSVVKATPLRYETIFHPKNEVVGEREVKSVWEFFNPVYNSCAVDWDNAPRTSKAYISCANPLLCVTAAWSLGSWDGGAATSN
ncbi:hypothetical protein BDQ17DRAFT_1336238 [Cyathus striatus]|nr:hypothetical protein BDQ17DRAFT_1336238 [Cyathus striatus]